MQNINFLPKSRWLVTIILLLSLGISQMRAGTATITEDFEKQTAGTTYNSTQDYTAANSNAGIAWYVEHGTVSTNAYLDDTKSMHMRAYYAKNSASTTWNGNLPYVYSKTNVKGLVSITFDAAVSSTKLKVDVMYSTDNGSSWSSMKQTSADGSNWSNVSLTTSKASYTAYIPTAALSPTGDYRIKIAVNSGSTHTNKPSSAGNFTFRVDNIAFTYTAYTVTYNGNGNTGGSVPTDATKYTSGSTVTVKSNSGSLVKTGYDFGGWNTNSSGTGTNYTAGSGTFTITANTTLYAKWESAAACSANPSIGNASINGSVNLSSVPFTCSVTSEGGAGCSISDAGFVWKDGSDPSASDNKTAGTYSTSITGTIPSAGSFSTGKTYYVKAYATNDNGTALSSTSYQFRAQSITFYGNTNTGGSMSVQYVEYNKSTALTTNGFSKTGHSFAGWATSSSGSVVYTDGQSVTATGNMELYAKWSVSSYDVTLKANGGSGDDQVVSATYGAAMPTTLKGGGAIVAPSRNGYTFAGYYDTDASTGGTQYYTNTLASANTWDKDSETNLHARWTANQYTVTLDANGGEDGATTSVTTTFGEAMPTIASAYLPTKEGYRFDGFYTEKTSGTKYYNADGTSAKNQARYSANQKLYAHWVAQTTFSVDGDIDASLTIDDGAAMPSADVPTACGDCWAFIGWSTDSEEDGIPTYSSGDTHEFGEPQTLFAVFGKTEYELISSTSELVANDYYVLTNIKGDAEYALSNTANPDYSNDAASTDVTDKAREYIDGYYLYSVGANNVWKFTGTYSSGQLQNVENTSLYLNLSGSGKILSSSDNLTFSNSSIFWTIHSTNYLRHYSANDWDDVSSSTLASGDGFSAFIYHQISAEYTTTPSCDTYTITWKKNGTSYTEGDPTDETTTCAGIETLPTDPANNSLSCANVFMGWSEEDLSGEDNEEPEDLFWKIGDAPKITENKIFNAVFATGTPVANTYELISPSELRNGQIVLIVNHSNNVAVSSTANGDQLTAVSVSPSEETITTSETSIRWTVTKDGNYYVFKSGNNYLRSSAKSKLQCDGTSDKWSISAGTVDGTYLMTSNNSSYNFEYYSSKFTTYDGTGTAYNVDFYVQSMTYSDYVTNCCTAYTISGASKSGTDVIVSGNTGGTLKSNYNSACKDASVTLNATVNPGYAFGGWTITGATSGDLTNTLLPGDNATSLTPAAFEMPGENITVSATITEKTVTGWTWKQYLLDESQITIPATVELFIGQEAWFDLIDYIPGDVLEGKKGYTATYNNDDLAQGGKGDTRYKIRAKVAKDEMTLTLTSTNNSSVEEVITIKGKALPTVTFVDNVHNKTDFTGVPASGILSASVDASDKRIVYLTKATPTHADLSVPGSGNACELSHLVLIGWIRSDCPDVAAYMSGTGSKPGNTAITGAGVDDEDRAYYIAAGSDIDVEDYNGLTFYAVWAKVE